MIRRTLSIAVALAIAVPVSGTAQAGGDSAAQTPPVRVATTPAAPRPLPGAQANVHPTIRGSALNARQGALSNTVVRLRDARSGHIVDTQTTDNAGAFSFTVDPGAYVVEIVGPDGTTLAASDIIGVNAGDAVTAAVRLPFHTPPLGGVLGRTPSAALITAQAIAAGVLAVAVTGSAVSGTQPF